VENVSLKRIVVRGCGRKIVMSMAPAGSLHARKRQGVESLRGGEKGIDEVWEGGGDRDARCRPANSREKKRGENAACNIDKLGSRKNTLASGPNRRPRGALV